MKIFKVSIATLAVIGILSLSSSTIVFAATTPSLGAAASFSVLSSTYSNTVAGTTINGDLGYTSAPAVLPMLNGASHIGDAVYNQAGMDQGAALANLNSQACTFTFATGVIDLATDTTHGTIGVYTPGVYCTSGAASIGTAGITLNGSGTYIFRVVGALTTVANSSVALSNGASACNVFWTPTAATTLGANSTFIGTNIDPSGITIGSTVTQIGRSLAFGGTVTSNADTVSVPTCTGSTPTPTSMPTPTVTPSSTPIATPSPTVTVAPSVTPTPTVTPTLVPGLPNTGVNSGSNTPWGIMVVASLSIVLFVVKRKQII
jgi:LPXTG-motif cell wall-anchored protein